MSKNNNNKSLERIDSDKSKFDVSIFEVDKEKGLVNGTKMCLAFKKDVNQ